VLEMTDNRLVFDPGESYPFMMKYSDVCSVLGIKDRQFYKLLKKNRFVYVRVNGSDRIPAAMLMAYIIEGPEFNRSDDFILECYRESLCTFPNRMTLKEVCDYLNISKSTIKRMMADNSIKTGRNHNSVMLYVKKDDLIDYLMANTIK
jgi:predicted DNA-binding transcriptional regulator AlpA